MPAQDDRSPLPKGRFAMLNCLQGSYSEDIRRDVREGLSSGHKSIPSKYFYDSRGSRLFEKICGLPEYYQTRTELSILENSAAGIVGNFRKGDLVELGSGANWKIRALLDKVPETDLPHVHYLPVDVSESVLLEASEELLGIFPDLKVFCIVGDFTKPIEYIPAGCEKLFVIFGSTIGNLTEQEGCSLLKGIARCMGARDRLLIGTDMIKPKDILEAAYNDSQGITSEFNKNILHVLNRELHAHFNPRCFDHMAFYNPEEEQVEMHLQANRRISVEIEELDMTIGIRKGETIRTEICRKFSRTGIEKMAGQSGLRISRWFSDPKEWFCLTELVRWSA